jgi:hypothetical protein
MNTFAPSDLKSYVCVHVFSRARPILLVVREQREWMFLCGRADHGGHSDYLVIGIGHVTELEASVSECADLPDDCEAERKAVGAPWIRTPISASSN